MVRRAAGRWRYADGACANFAPVLNGDSRQHDVAHRVAATIILGFRCERRRSDRGAKPLCNIASRTGRRS